MPSFGVASNAVPVHRAVGYSWRLLQLYLQYCTSLLATRPDGWRGCSRLIRLECTQWMTTRTLMMLVGLGPKSANEDLNVNETSILPVQRLRFSRIVAPCKNRLVQGGLSVRVRRLRAPC